MSVGDGAITIADLAYTAGIIDGEGSIMVKRSKENRPGRPTREYRIVVSVGNTNRLLLEWLLVRWEGSIKPYIRKIPNCKPVYTWTLSAKSAVMFLKLIKDFLVIKKDQAELALIFQTTVKSGGSWSRLTPETLQTREDCFNKMAILNKRGVI
jgi:hypothetical protein